MILIGPSDTGNTYLQLIDMIDFLLPTVGVAEATPVINPMLLFAARLIFKLVMKNREKQLEKPPSTPVGLVKPNR